MPHKIPRNRPQTRLCHQQVNLLCKLGFQPVLLIRIKIGTLNRIQNLIRDLGILQIDNPLAAILIVERHRRTVLHRPLEVVDRHIAAERPRRDRIMREQRRPRETDPRPRRQHPHHILCKDPVLTAVRLIRHNNDIVRRVDRRGIGPVELLDQRKDKTRIPAQLRREILPTRRDELRRLALPPEHAAAGECITDLAVQLLAIRQHDKGRRPRHLAPHLLCEKQHRVTLARALRMPEHTEPAAVQRAICVRLHRLIHTEILMIACQNLCRLPGGVIV